jgi:hypothetical protein
MGFIDRLKEQENNIIYLDSLGPSNHRYIWNIITQMYDLQETYCTLYIRIAKDSYKQCAVWDIGAGIIETALFTYDDISPIFTPKGTVFPTIWKCYSLESLGAIHTGRMYILAQPKKGGKYVVHRVCGYTEAQKILSRSNCDIGSKPEWVIVWNGMFGNDGICFYSLEAFRESDKMNFFKKGQQRKE